MSADQAPDASVAPLPFGIPQLDRLLGYDGVTAAQEEGCTKAATSLSIVGSDGTGKSVFALHIASTYLALVFNEYYQRFVKDPRTGAPSFPLVFYASSDLRYQAAKKIWDNFYLDCPWHRYVPFLPQQDLQTRRDLLREQRLSPLSAGLTDCRPGDENVARRLKEHRTQLAGNVTLAPVSFLDLATQTTGDDWLFVARLMAALPRPGPAAAPNLLILDSVAGFETMVGERNSFGERMSRRARVAQLIRAAGDSWHTVFVVEEPDAGNHLPEEYVTDTVLHLRRYGEGEHARRFLEIEKSRARAFGVGEHPFEIRDGAGTSTGSWENPDDPHTLLHREFWDHLKRPTHRNPHNAYIQVFPSLHYLSREFARRRVLQSAVPVPDAVLLQTADGEASRSATHEHVRFNITYLDNMLAVAPDGGNGGLPGGSTTALVGDEGTRKATLAEHFLAEAFSDLPAMLGQAIAVVKRHKERRRAGDLPEQSIDQYLAEESGRWSALAADTSAVEARFWQQIKRNLPTFEHRQRELKEIENTQWELKSEIQLKAEVEGRPYSDVDHDHIRRSGPLKTRWDAKFHYREIRHTAPDPEPTSLHTFILALSILRMSWGLLPSTVFVSTHDTSSDKVSALIVKRHQEALAKRLWEECRVDANASDGIALAAIKHLLERFILVRRVELVDSTAPQLWHIIHSIVTHALYLLGNPIDKVLAATDPLAHASGVRVVVSDLRLIRDTYPAVAGDPLFLPTLTFRLKRLGVTSLFVDSDNGRPDQLPSHPMNGALRSLVDHQIYTWKVPFFGEQRVAIAVIPAMNPNRRGVIRELCHTRTGDDLETEKVDVNPHFELYMGLEEGKPTAVPLQVILYEETKAFAEYIDAESQFFSRVFSPLPGDRPVIQVQRTRDYDGLRDYCHLPVNTHLPYTLVFMVDGYWALGRGTLSSLRSQRTYLFTALTKYDDVFRLYRRTRQQSFVDEHLAQAPRKRGPKLDAIPKAGESVLRDRDERRVDYFSQPAGSPGRFFYKSRLLGPPKEVDRVPFMWDFGFLLCNEHQWNTAAAIRISAKRSDGEKLSVGEIWYRLRRLAALERTPADPKENEPRPHRDQQGTTTLTLQVDALLGQPVLHQGCSRNVTWREFLEASFAVAQAEERRTGEKVPVFDLAMATPESILCWLVEIWFSEIVEDALQMQRFAEILAESNDPDDKLLATAAGDWLVEFRTRLGDFSQSEYEQVHTGKRWLQDYLRGTERGIALGLASALKKARECRQDGRQELRKARRVATIVTTAPGFSLQLYRTWLLLLDSIDFSTYQDPDRPFSLKADFQPAPSAVSTRHWYKTACASAAAERSKPGDTTVIRTKVPVRLPGHFTTRGDWFLGVAKGSRSYRLADQALDMLTSRRANRTRLHRGMGLPTRDLLEGSLIEQIRTALAIWTPDGQHHVRYGQLLALGGQFYVEPLAETSKPPETSKPDAKPPNEDSFFWFYRSGFRDYDRQAIAVQRWMHRMLSWTLRYRDQHRASWRDHTGFLTYDEMRNGDFEALSGFDSFPEFAKGLDVFAADLDHCVVTDTQDSNDTP
jgi:KaiC/GvpD/RAD55 family RecA-like ATPase